MTLTFVPVGRPLSLANQPNGILDPSMLTTIHSRGQLHVQAGRSWRALVADAGNNGLPLTFTYGGMYRTFTEQRTLFLQRYTTVNTGRSRKWWDGRWWYLKPGVASAAVPGTSNHGWGLAIDVAFDKDPSDGLGPDDAAGITSHPKWGWFQDNAPRYGFSWEDPAEPWHIRLVTGDSIPQAVLNWEAGVIPSFPPFDPEHGVWGLWPIASKPVIKMGDHSDAVKYLQGVLKIKGWDIGPIDGWFGSKTEKGVIDLQNWCHLVPDGWVGTQTWGIVDTMATS